MARQRLDLQHHQIPTKANRILYCILIALILIAIRLWHLSVIQYDQRQSMSKRPQQRMVIEPAVRATIRDRFGEPLAINKVSYQLTVLYSQLKDIPPFQWKVDQEGKKIRIPKRKLYIRELSELLAKEANLDPDRVEDLIHSKASYYSQVPFILKDHLSEKEYYRLRFLENEWPGIHVRRVPKRNYPLGKTGGEIIGYMGAINTAEYEKILYEIKALEIFIADCEAGFEADFPEGIASSAQARQRLKELQAKAYTMRDHVGKTGIEKKLEEQLRGYYGKKVYQADSKGNFLRDLPGSRDSIPGERVTLTLSSELQEYAEQLLAENEAIRIVRKSRITPPKKTVFADKSPWIKGGAIVAMEVKTGDVLALASYPRIDPNAFVLQGSEEEVKQKKREIHHWFENDLYLAQLWNLVQPLERERFSKKKENFYEELRWLTWSNYLHFILPLDSPLSQTMKKIATLGDAVHLQMQVKGLESFFPVDNLYAIFNVLYSSEPHETYGSSFDFPEKQKWLEKAQSFKEQIDPYFSHLPSNYDKVLVIDLCRLLVDPESLTEECLAQKKETSLEAYRDESGSLYHILEKLKEKTAQIYHKIAFREWRKENERDFLRKKRSEEKECKTYARPYIDYLDKQEQTFFHAFWNTHRWSLLLTFLKEESSQIDNEDLQPYKEALQKWVKECKDPLFLQHVQRLKNSLAPLSWSAGLVYLQSFRFYQDLTRPLKGKYRGLRGGACPQEKDLAAAFYPVYGYGYGRSHAYRQATVQGSLFKIVTAYEALIQRFQQLEGKILSPTDLNPLVITDKTHHKGNQQYVGYTEDGKGIPQLYKGGRVPRSLAHEDNGRVDLIRALEVSSNPYFALLAGDVLKDPEDLAQAARSFGFGAPTGIDLPGEIGGKIPSDLSTNRTGLYATSIGQHSLVVTPLQTAVMLSSLANGGKVMKPKIIQQTEGAFLSQDISLKVLPDFPYQESLSLVGIDFPLFSKPLSHFYENKVKKNASETKRKIALPDPVRQFLLKGLKKAANRTYQENLASLTRLYREYPEAIRDFKDMKESILGKTSTSEAVESIDLDLKEGTNIYTHVWFGSIFFDQERGKKNPTVFLLKDEFGEPEIVVVVYLRYGGYGKEAAPLAAQVIKKWKEIKNKREG